MDVRKAHVSTASPSTKEGRLNWISGIKGEFKKITWTSREELRAYTKIVVGATLVIGLGIYVLDLLVQGALSGLGSFVRAIIG
ncbi:MAG: preprotein translocase subunit SecE [Verrucomicrobia bacterium]|nr:preprotein translocase subunit SecE [Verrucomicrobiota bacterium]